MTNKSVEIGQIEESLMVVYTAFCERCGTEVSDNYDERSFAKKLHEEGWRVSDDLDALLCPKCAKKLITP